MGYLECGGGFGQLARWSPVMASCSLYTPGAKESLLIPKQELDNLLVFERIDAEGDWVREIHWHTSNSKKGKHYVLFRNKDNRKFSTRKELIDYLQYQELRTDELEVQRFRNWNEKLVRDNRVGANKVAKMEARRWVNEVSGEALFDCYLTVRSREDAR